MERLYKLSQFWDVALAEKQYRLQQKQFDKLLNNAPLYRWVTIGEGDKEWAKRTILHFGERIEVETNSMDSDLLKLWDETRGEF